MDMGWTISGLSFWHLASHCLFIAGSFIAYTALCPFLALPCSHWLLQCCAHITNARVASARMHVGSRRLAHISFGERVVRIYVMLHISIGGRVVRKTSIYVMLVCDKIFLKGVAVVFSTYVVLFEERSGPTASPHPLQTST